MWIIRSIFSFIKFVIVVGAIFLAYVGFTRGPEKVVYYILTTKKICEVAYTTLDGDKMLNRGKEKVSENFIPMCLDFASATGTSMETLYKALTKSKKKLSTCSKMEINGEVVLHRGGEGIGKYKIKYKDVDGSRFVCVSALGADMIKIPADKFDEFLRGMKECSEES